MNNREIAKTVMNMTVSNNKEENEALIAVINCAVRNPYGVQILTEELLEKALNKYDPDNAVGDYIVAYELGQEETP